jgi:hypothetical protein
MHALLIALSLVVSADKKNDTMHNLLKDATSGANTDPDGGTPGPDVEKMPFTPDSIKIVMQYYQPQIQSCYEESLAAKNVTVKVDGGTKHEKNVEGKLVTAFNITPEGTVSDAKISKKGTTLNDPKLHECVTTVLGTIAFPKPNDGKKKHPIEFPFMLHTAN